jgi:ABC-type polysaccharide/polyol phosphate transport system ATPase subunit
MTVSTSQIAVAGVWKKFRRGELHDSLRDLIPAFVRRAARRQGDAEALGHSDFWALQDVSFVVNPGEALGVIGPNGAGKSTLLKLLTRILRPTRGHIAITGRVGALIEIAAGFHPDLTGRDNVSLQGAIMGMSRTEVRRKFDEIVAFAGLEAFIDTPVKRYSSGMSARLGFAIAAHLDPDVLLVDEILAVGDFAFQRKAFSRMAELVRRSIPVVLVSHQLDRIAELCTSAIYLRNGRVVCHDTAAACVAAYLTDGKSDAKASRGPILIRAVDWAAGIVASGEYVELRIVGCAREAPSEDGAAIGVRIRSLESGGVLFATHFVELNAKLRPGRDFVLDVGLQMNVPPGMYTAEVVVWDPLSQSDVATGPIGRVSVAPGSRFWGSVQMNPRVRLSDLASGVEVLSIGA